MVDKDPLAVEIEMLRDDVSSFSLLSSARLLRLGRDKSLCAATVVDAAFVRVRSEDTEEPDDNPSAMPPRAGSVSTFASSERM